MVFGGWGGESLTWEVALCMLAILNSPLTEASLGGYGFTQLWSESKVLML